MNITKSKCFFVAQSCAKCVGRCGIRTLVGSPPNGFQDFYADDERSERRHGERDKTELRHGERDATERRDGESDTPDAGTVNAIRRNSDTVNTIRSERRDGERDVTERRHGESDAAERRYKTVGGRRRADQRIFSMPIFWTLRPSFS